MNEQELRTAESLREGMAKGWLFAYVSARNAIRAYNKHGVTIMSIDLDGVSGEAEAEFFDIITPAL